MPCRRVFYAAFWLVVTISTCGLIGCLQEVPPEPDRVVTSDLQPAPVQTRPDLATQPEENVSPQPAEKDSSGTSDVEEPPKSATAGQPVEAPPVQRVAIADSAEKNSPEGPTSPAVDDALKPLPAPPEAQGLKRLAPAYDVWLDKAGGRLVMAGKICVRQGALEMFACLAQTKEHESVVAVNTKAMNVHAALMLLGAEPGRPVQWQPEYRPASGTEIDVTVHWTDEDGKRRQASAQDWIRNVQTGQALAHPWVFAGSAFWKSADGATQRYLAEDGDFICVSNFPTAMLDLPIASTQSDQALLFEAWKERIPERDTIVSLVLKPKKKEKPVEAPAVEE